MSVRIGKSSFRLFLVPGKVWCHARSVCREKAADSGKKAWRVGCEVHLSRFGWGARPVAVVPRRQDGFRGSEGFGRKDAPPSGAQGCPASGIGLPGVLLGQCQSDWRDSG